MSRVKGIHERTLDKVVEAWVKQSDNELHVIPSVLLAHATSILACYAAGLMSVSADPKAKAESILTVFDAAKEMTKRDIGVLLEKLELNNPFEIPSTNKTTYEDIMRELKEKS